MVWIVSRFFQFFSPFIHLLICPFDAVFFRLMLLFVIGYFCSAVAFLPTFHSQFTRLLWAPVCVWTVFLLLLLLPSSSFSYFHRFSHSKFYAKSTKSLLIAVSYAGVSYALHVQCISFCLKIYTIEHFSLSPTLDCRCVYIHI